MLGSLRSSNELECEEWKSFGLNEADGWQFRKQRPVHQPGSPFCVSLGLCTICKRKTIEERGGQGMNIAYALVLVCVILMLVSMFTGQWHEAHAYS